MTKTDAPGSRRTLLTLTVTAAIVATAVLIAFSQSGTGTGEAEELFSGIPQDGTTLGEPGAPVTISVYEDFQCPFCGQFSREVLPQVVRDHVRDGEAKVVSRPLVFLGEDSFRAAEAALAAGEQDRYWQYHSLLFENQGAENSGYVTDEFLDGLAGQISGLDFGRWNDRRVEGSVEAEIGEAESEARASGVDSTPTVIVGGPGGERRLTGEDPGEISVAVRAAGGL